MAGRPPTVARMARKRRETPISYRPPAKLRDEFHTRARNSGLSLNGFITRAVFGGEAPRTRRKPPVEQADLAVLMALAASIADRLAAQPEEAREETLSSCHEELVLIRTCLMQIMGRDP